MLAIFLSLMGAALAGSFVVATVTANDDEDDHETTDPMAQDDTGGINESLLDHVALSSEIEQEPEQSDEVTELSELIAEVTTQALTVQMQPNKWVSTEWAIAPQEEEDTMTTQILDFDAESDAIAVIWDDSSGSEPPALSLDYAQTDSSTVLVQLDGVTVAEVANAPDLGLNDIALLPESQASPDMLQMAAAPPPAA